MRILQIWAIVLCLKIATQEVTDYYDNITQDYKDVNHRNKRFPYLGSNFVEDKYLKKAYDFIIVGSGSSGSVLANRLSEIKHWNILLLETGEIPTMLTEVPVLAAMFQFTNYNWGYLTEKQSDFGLGLVDERISWPRGKVLGGSTVINYMMHVRGNKLDYDRWEATGNPGWSYKDVLPYFKKSEDSTVKIHDPAYRSTRGYLSVEDIAYRTESAHAFVKAAQEVGYQYVDYNGKNQLGVSYVQSTTKRGLRCTADWAFLRPTKHRPNLTILTKSRVTKVLIDTTTKRAYGVKFIKNRRYHIVRASKEVILSAGVLNSPQLLMLSGVGPKEHLNELNITVLQNLPVGKKICDHLVFLGLVFKVNQSIVIQQKDVEDLGNFMQLILHGVGPLTSLGGVEALAFLKTNASTYPENYPDIELIFIGGGMHIDRGEIHRKVLRISDKVYNQVWKNLEGSYACTVYPVLLHPKSYGYLKLKSTNPFHSPKFYGNYLTDPNNEDLRTLIAGIREIQRILKAPAFAKYDTQQVTTPIPGCEHHVFDTDTYWECAIRHISGSLYHQTSTCKMGPINDPEAVVDSRFRVYGIKDLRVVDTSAIPIPLSAHTNVPAYMIGEKASDLIKEDWMKPENLIRSKRICNIH